MKIYLCGNTGFINRGCEAIVDSTVRLLPVERKNIVVMSHTAEYDKRTANKLGVELRAYSHYPSVFHHLVCGIAHRVFGIGLFGLHYIQASLFETLTKDDTCLNIGGDTYCYDKPVLSYSLNRFTSERQIKNILWCCSIGKDNITKEMVDDLKKYSLIFVREEITYQNLLDIGLERQKLIKCCDPAFFLPEEKVELPKEFVADNTVGINISDLVYSDKSDACYAGIKRLISFVLNETDMHVCLIPHVYSITPPTQDYCVLSGLYGEVRNPRVSIVDREYNCEQLKYIISRCRFIVTARTHASIAAYSAAVPTLVLGYSVKSKGIATDLFGTYEGYVLPREDVKNEKVILDTFKDIMKNEQAIRKRLNMVLPSYKQTLTDAIERYIRK